MKFELRFQEFALFFPKGTEDGQNNIIEKIMIIFVECRICTLCIMNKKAIYICTAVLAALVAFVIGAVVVLYSDKTETSSIDKEELLQKARSARPLMSAVPSDAALVFYGDKLKSSLEVFEDSTYLVGTLFSGTGKSNFGGWLSKLSKFIDTEAPSGLKNAETVVSMHYSGDLAPLLVVDAGRISQDSPVQKLFALADSSSVSHLVIDLTENRESPLKKHCLIAFSPSETLLKSCSRHIEYGVSLLDDESLSSAVYGTSGNKALFVSGNYVDKLAGSFLSRQRRSGSRFLKTYAEWTGITLTSADEKTLTMTGRSFSVDSPAYFSNIYRNLLPGESLFPEIVPAGVRSVYSVQVADAQAYSDRMEKYVDAVGKLDSRRARWTALKKESGISPDAWYKALAVREVAVAEVPSGSGFGKVILVRPGKQDLSVIFRGSGITSLRSYDGKPIAYPFRGFASSVFGDMFSVPDSVYIYRNGWIIAGEERSLEAFAPEKYKTLASFLSDAGAGRIISREGTAFQAYYSASVSPDEFASLFSKNISASACRILDKVTSCPMTLAIYPGEDARIEFSVARMEYTGAKDEVPVMKKDTVVTVPSGLFKVKNCGTGKTNLFSQQKNMYLTLKEENGKGIWGVPFQTPICGAVETIDYFGNGKLQFLFASGSSLYLIDRLGRFVKPFPVDLGKEILLGPAVFDFTGAHGYNVLVLHKDNTIAMYDLHAKKPSSWKDIKSDETIKSLPELLVAGNRKYWIVRTSVRTLIYGFYGGNPVLSPEGNKMLSPDTEVSVNDKRQVTARCYDGKERSFKLQ